MKAHKNKSTDCVFLAIKRVSNTVLDYSRTFYKLPCNPTRNRKYIVSSLVSVVVLNLHYDLKEQKKNPGFLIKKNNILQ